MLQWQEPLMPHEYHFLTLKQPSTCCFVYALDTSVEPFYGLAGEVPISRIIIDGYEQHASQGKAHLRMSIINFYSFNPKTSQFFHQRCKVHIDVVTRLFWALDYYCQHDMPPLHAQPWRKVVNA